MQSVQGTWSQNRSLSTHFFFKNCQNQLALPSVRHLYPRSVNLHNPSDNLEPFRLKCALDRR